MARAGDQESPSVTTPGSQSPQTSGSEQCKNVKLQIDGSPFVYNIFQASSGRELDKNKGLLDYNLYFLQCSLPPV